LTPEVSHVTTAVEALLPEVLQFVANMDPFALACVDIDPYAPAFVDIDPYTPASVNTKPVGAGLLAKA
jgi:hypothetical protein